MTASPNKVSPRASIAAKWVVWFGVLALLSLTAIVAAKPSIAAAQGCLVNPPPIALPAPTAESTLTADQASLQNQVAEARGNVRLERNGQALEAPYVRYDRKTGEASARNGVRYYRPGLYLTAQNGEVQTNARTGRFNDTTYSVTGNGGRGKAATVAAVGDGRFELTDADYSTCDGNTKAWLLSAQRIELDRNRGRGEAYDTTLRLYGVPVLYSPYLNFPIDDQRHTGVLAPTLGATGGSGFELAVPYYINLAPNYDATLVPRILGKRGLQLGGQLRYLHAHHVGEVDGQYLPDDQEYDDDRSLFHFEHVGRFNRHVGIDANYTRVSDDAYFDDLSSDLSRTSSSQLERAVRLSLVNPGVRFTLLAQDFQTLDDTDNDRFSRSFSNDPYRRLPQARLELLTPSAPLRAGLDAGFSNFKRDDALDAVRIDAQPRLLWGVDRGGWYADSEANYRITQYQLHDIGAHTDRDTGAGYRVAAGDDVINRGIGQFRIDSGLRFARRFSDGWIQTLEPRVQYLYTGYEDQSDIPVFDSGVADLHYDRLFADNRFTGSDRIGDANELTLGVTSRFVAPDSGRTVAQLALGRVTGFRDLRVTLPGHGETGYGDRGSDYVASARLSPIQRLRAHAIVQYDPDSSRVNRAIAGLGYATDSGYRFDLAYRRYRDYRPARRTTHHTTRIVADEYETLEQTAIGVRAPVTDRVDILGRWNYSLERSRNVETLAGLEIRPSCCWAGRVAFRHYVANDDGSTDNALLFQFILNGLGRFGDTVHSFVDNDVFSDDRATGAPGRRSDSAFDTIRFP